MNTSLPEDAPLENGDVSPLRLRLTHSHGELRNRTLHIPPDGAGMAEALERCGERQGDVQWRLANLCRIRLNGSAQRWHLQNNSYTLMCVRNGERVPPGRPVLLAEGDQIELGLLRFVVEPWEAPMLEEKPFDPVMAAPAVDSQEPAEQPASDFELSDLASDPGSSGTTSSHHDAPADPFWVLGLAGTTSRSAADVLSGLLGESPQSAATSTPVGTAKRPSAGSHGVASLLDELHEEFVRVVRDPGQLAGRADWEGLLFAHADPEPAPSLDELRKQAEPYPLLRDILQPREGIDRVIEEFEPLGRSGLLEAQPNEDVLGLFAPELTSEGARAASMPLPSLTRREHHALSPDSHLRLGPARAMPEDADQRGGAA